MFTSAAVQALPRRFFLRGSMRSWSAFPPSLAQQQTQQQQQQLLLRQPAEPKSFYSQGATGTRPTSLADSRRFFSASASTPSASSPFLQSYAQHVNERMQEAEDRALRPSLWILPK